MSAAVGNWKVEITTPLGIQHVKYVFDLDDNELRGVAVQDDENTVLTELSVRGSHLSWLQQTTRPLKLKLRFEVDINGDSLSGTARAVPLPAVKVTGTRELS